MLIPVGATGATAEETAALKADALAAEQAAVMRERLSITEAELSESLAVATSRAIEFDTTLASTGGLSADAFSALAKGP